MNKTRVAVRFRTRPYDLRRRVLVKNFLREQMTIVPRIRISPNAINDEEVNDETDSNENSPNFDNEEVGNSRTNSEHDEKTPDNVSSSTSSNPSVPECVPSTSGYNDKENASDLSNNLTETLPVVEKTGRLSRISNLLTNRRKWKRGIVKAKHNVQTSKKAFDRKSKNVDNDAKSTGIRPKSFFEMFKSRREKKRGETSNICKNNSADENKSSSATSTQSTLDINALPNLTQSCTDQCKMKCNTSCADKNETNFSALCVECSVRKNNTKVTTATISTQTDRSALLESYERMKKKNKDLCEENRYLSESLSNVFNDVNFSLRQNSGFTDCLTDVYNNKKEVKTEHNYSQNQRADILSTRVLRSNSVQERSNESRRPLRRNKSAIRLQIPKSSPNKLHSDTKDCHGIKSILHNRNRKSPIASIVNVSRPHTRKSVQILNKGHYSVQPVVRRSSMPERTHNRSRPVIRSSSVRENNFYYEPTYLGYRNIRRGAPRFFCKTSNRCSYSVPFQDLPSDAFY
ncbi:uncharacterized protein CEXT_344431 [Caerostris extrusa]|uniref:Uncharacterized protein n=1 Tax=Caerostris extrusa TaxID=172846 RepID=A0AAV4MDJ9_CAEEX|nr:uncharacterized protein CEXT_344431 [Caerostris extrusa]